MNKQSRKEIWEKLIKEAKLKVAIEQADQTVDQNEASEESYGKKFTDALIDNIKISGLED
jgi:hypothetical protein